MARPAPLRCLALLLPLFAAAPAWAGVVSVSKSYSNYQGWVTNLELAQFDSRLGQLREVRMQFNFDSLHQYAVHNPYTYAIDADISFFSDFQLSGPVPMQSFMTRSVVMPLGVSADWTPSSERQSEQQSMKMLAHLDGFIGTGRWSFWVRNQAGAGPNYWKPDIADVMSVTIASIQLKVDYLYDDAPAPQPQPQPEPRPLPEPAAPLLAGVALLAAGLQRRARRQA